MAPPVDFKNRQHLYRPSTEPVIVDVPEILFIAMDGRRRSQHLPPTSTR